MPKMAKSPWLLHYDGSSCNGCDIEVLACLTPVYDIERFGVINTGNPKHAVSVHATAASLKSVIIFWAAWIKCFRWISMCPAVPPGPKQLWTAC